MTKGGKLAKDMKNREEEVNKYSKERIKIVEVGGIRIKNILVKKNPFPNERCDMKKCLVCDSNVSGEIKIPCNSNNVGYQLICDTCSDNGIQKVYEGETSRSARIRGVEHLRSYNGDKIDSVLYKHKHNDHGDEDITFCMKITKKF